MRTDLWLYVVHLAFWASFWLGRSLLRGDSAAPASATAATAAEAPRSRALIGLHMVGFFFLYFGVGSTVIPGRVPEVFGGQRLAGAVIIACGAGIATWAMTAFRSWRFRAALTPGHELATTGPFAVVRHPIYLALDLLALGTALWVPHPVVIAGVALILAAGDLRARAEERLLDQAFGAAWADYRARTSRFVPGLY
jgi:protein-S-isoprenylcysteine O-methyltransferase Ste14